MAIKGYSLIIFFCLLSIIYNVRGATVDVKDDTEYYVNQGSEAKFGCDQSGTIKLYAFKEDGTPFDSDKSIDIKNGQFACDTAFSKNATKAKFVTKDSKNYVAISAKFSCKTASSNSAAVACEVTSAALSFVNYSVATFSVLVFSVFSSTLI